MFIFGTIKALSGGSIHVCILLFACLICAEYIHRDPLSFYLRNVTKYSRCMCFLLCFTSHHHLPPLHSYTKFSYVSLSEYTGPGRRSRCMEYLITFLK